MRRIVHISDIHFGREDAAVVERLVEKIVDLKADVMAISGDLTQRARTAQFAAAREFLSRIPGPHVIVPGNHDVPLYNVAARFVKPLDKYKSYITEDLEPFFHDDEVAVAGLNTSRSFTIKGGRINAQQAAAVYARMKGLDDVLLKVVVTHHPFDVPDGQDEDDIVGRAREAMPIIANGGADVFLAGHLHVSHIGSTARRYRFETGRSALMIQAGTAASVRERGEENSFNLLEWERPILSVKRFQCSIASVGFYLASDEKFTQTQVGWERL